ncbi:FAD-binding domain-containing protein, partial [Apiospora rasikravindrae]
CADLISALGDKVHLPGSVAYDASLASYFSAQAADLNPACIVSPDTVQDVTASLQIMTSPSPPSDASKGVRDCPFAVRSGGHTLYHGAANIAQGVTVDLKGLSSVHVSPDGSAVSAGPAATWDKLYTALDPLGLSVVGGRTAGVGPWRRDIFFSPRYGWTCDTVSAFQVVLANGSVVEANTQQNPSLFKALRGGSNNFGIVTRVDLQTFQQEQMWGGMAYHPMSTLEDHVEEFVGINSAEDYDEFASLVTSFGFNPEVGAAISDQMIYTKPLPNPPPIYERLLDLPTLLSTMRLTNMTDLALETSSFQTQGLRYVYLTNTVYSTPENLRSAFESFNASLPSIQSIQGIQWSVTLEPLPPAIYTRHAAANSLGMENRTEALVVVLLTASWELSADDDTIYAAANRVLTRINQEAQNSGSWDPFVYLNYAGASQDPVSAYGEKSVDHLRQVRDEVDPNFVFTKMVPGGFKIPVDRS